MVERLDQLLQRCTVKVTVPGQGWGTGFLVAPGLVLTCAHVVRTLKPDVAAQIAWQQQEELAEATIVEAISELDLALLKFSPSLNMDLPCVYLGEAFQPNDDFYIFGYPDSFPQGTSVTGLCEGRAIENNSPLIVFKSAQVRPGLSGSPLLNLNTGMVCGIVKFTKDRSIDLGGGAIPVSVILEQFPELTELQQQFHQLDRRWRDLAARLSDEKTTSQINSGGISYQTQTGANNTNVFGDVHYHYSSSLADAQPTSPLKFGVPFPKVRLPDNFVERPGALNAVKAKLLAEDARSLVVSAISGLGGLGKSVLATALVLDDEVQKRFIDGILWVTLGQNPDLQTMLGEWIRELDKSREAFSANTLESASRYLDSLLVERRMLLVVDDVWNARHVEWFRVGGAGCRVLVTTREAQIEAAEYYSLDLMSESEAIDLVRQKLKQQWRPQQEAEVKTFAKLLGYLPLALDLATNQVQDGLTWAELQSEFEVERRAVALEVLDQSEAWERLDEEQQRTYSLRACFNLSLRRLQAEQLQQFSWLGVLPEDVNLEARVASVLWNVPLLKAKKGLIDLRRRSFLTDGVATSEGERTYRVHDLMHDMARGLIEKGTLDLPIQNPKSKIQNFLALAHRQFLEHYQARAADCYWDKLPNDGYIYRHLTWHMEQADWVDEVHALMAMSDNHGRNAWFEACDRIGHLAIFVEDVARGWRLAEQKYQQDRTESIVLQCRYALIRATLNSLINNLPIDLMAEFVKRGFWTIEQAWAYVEQIQDEKKIAAAFQALTPDLSKLLFQAALRKAQSIQDEPIRAKVLSNLATLEGADLAVLLQAARTIKSEDNRAKVLSNLARLDRAYFAEALEVARTTKPEFRRSYMLSNLAALEGADFAALLEAARAMKSEGRRAEVLSNLAALEGADFAALLEVARAMKSEDSQAEVLSNLAALEGADFAALLEVARAMKSKDSQAEVLSNLAKFDVAYFAEALEAARAIQFEGRRAKVLSNLAKFDVAYFAEALEVAQEIQDEFLRAEVLSNLTALEGADFAALLEAMRTIQDESPRAEALSNLAKRDGADFAALLQSARTIRSEPLRTKVLSNLAKRDGADFAVLLEATRTIQDESLRAKVLSDLAKLDGADFVVLLKATRTMKSESLRAKVLSNLVSLDGTDLAALLKAARTMKSAASRAKVLSNLAKRDEAYFAEALEIARTIQDESSRAEVLSNLAKHDGADFAALLEIARTIQDESSRAEVLSNLAKRDGAFFVEALDVGRAIQGESIRAEVLSNLAKRDGAFFAEALEAVRSIQDEVRRSYMLSNLATLDGADFAALLEASRTIKLESKRAMVLSNLAVLDGADLVALLKAVRKIKSEDSRAEVLSNLAMLDRAYFAEALKVVRTTKSEDCRAKVLSNLAAFDGADVAALLEATRMIQNESKRAKVLSHLAKRDGADFATLLQSARKIKSEDCRAKVLSNLTALDGADVAALLEATRMIQDESKRVEVLSNLTRLDRAYLAEALEAARSVKDEFRRAYVLSNLAALDGAYFAEALEAMRTIQDESKRAEVLSMLTTINGVDFAALLEDAQMIKSEDSRAEVLSNLAKHAPQNFLPNICDAILALTDKPTCAKALSTSLPVLSLATLTSPNWQVYLHLLAYRKRSDLMQDLGTLYPAIVHLGDESAMRGVVAAMHEVCSQWK